MRLRQSAFCFAIATMIGAASGDAADTRLRIDVSPRISSAPAVVRIRAIVTPDETNRALHIVADSGSFYRSSMVPLDGANAALVTEMTLKNLPGGRYDVTVVLVDTNGRRTSDRRDVVVTSMLGD
jgi:hypothetical protein